MFTVINKIVYRYVACIRFTARVIESIECRHSREFLFTKWFIRRVEPFWWHSVNVIGHCVARNTDLAG